jgi:hypothetical protein
MLTVERRATYSLRGKPEVGDTFTAANRPYEVIGIGERETASGRLVDLMTLCGTCTDCGEKFHLEIRRSFWPTKRCMACR